MDWCRSVVVCSVGAWGVLMGNLAWCGGPPYCAASGVVLCDETVCFCWVSGLCSVGWQVCCFKGCIGGLSAPCCVFQCFCKHIDFVLPYVYMVVQVSDCDGGCEPGAHWAGEHSFGDVSVGLSGWCLGECLCGVGG